MEARFARGANVTCPARSERPTVFHALQALCQDSERKLALIQRSVNKRLVETFRQFAAIEGSEVFDGFKNGTTRYLRYVLQK